MQLRADIQIKSILKAMGDVVLPAIDPGNQLAQEQARLCMGLLDLMARQLPVQFAFDLDELRRLHALGQQLAELQAGGSGAAAATASLQPAMRQAEDVLARAKASPEEVYGVLKTLRAATGAVVQDAASNGQAAEAVEQLVMRASKEQLLRDRSLLLPQRWEPNPDAIPPIETLLTTVNPAG